MSASRIYAIAGLKNSGKDTAAEMLQYLLNTPKILHSYFGYKKLKKHIKGKYQITSFAGPLKRTLAALLDIDLERFNDRDFKENGYIDFSTMHLTTNDHHILKTLSDNKFNKLLASKDLSFIQEYYISIRQLLQVFGTECMRTIFGDKIWVLLTLKNKDFNIISDLRFKTEYEAVKKSSGKVLFIKRDSAKPGNHASEKEVMEMYNENKYDIIIDNNKDLESLFNNLKQAI